MKPALEKIFNNILLQLNNTNKKMVQQQQQQQDATSDPSGWMIENSVSDFLLMPHAGIVYMCMFGYAFVHGCKVFKIAGDGPVSKVFIQLVMTCTGGGILVPIFINGIPVPLANDAYPIAIISSFLLHYYFPILRSVATQSKIVWPMLIILYEAQRASVVAKLTLAAGAKIAPSLFSFPVFGPIACGAIGGCGGAFLPLSKGLDPIKAGLQPPMMTALIGAACFHLYINTSLSDGCIDAKIKGKVFMALFFIAVGLVNALDLTTKEEAKVEKSDVSKVKKES
mmetsp:Transcript_11563/g.17503  ORF Transcript_11563/g.17503 Transcript_11563/m.17503 type:complete len:282 (+) Transcript_11563:167-1012(+)